MPQRWRSWSAAARNATPSARARRSNARANCSETAKARAAAAFERQRAEETSNKLKEASDALQAVPRPTVTIHIQSDEQQKASADRLLQELSQHGYKAPGIEQISAGPRKPELRYFRASERAAATELAGVLRENADLADLEARLVTGYEAKSVPLQFELWYGPPSRT